MGCGMGQVGTQCVPWPARVKGNWDVGHRMGQSGTQNVPWPAGGIWDMGWDRLVLSMSLSHIWGHGETGTWEMGHGMGQFGTQLILR